MNYASTIEELLIRKAFAKAKCLGFRPVESFDGMEVIETTTRREALEVIDGAGLSVVTFENDDGDRFTVRFSLGDGTRVVSEGFGRDDAMGKVLEAASV